MNVKKSRPPAGRHGRVALALSAAVVGLACWAGQASATILLNRTLAQLLKEADLVFQGEVERVRAEADANGEIWTLYEFGSVETIAGERAHDTFTVRCLGGELNGEGSLVSGTPQYEVGDRALIFYRADDDVCQIAGWEQGSFRIVADAPNGAETLVDEHGRQVVGLGPSDFVKGGKLPGWQRRAFGEATFVELNAKGEPTLVQADAAQTQGAAAADYRMLKGELKAMARSLKKNWRAVTRATTVVGRANPLGGNGNGAQP
jgi:hypothetical protein